MYYLHYKEKLWIFYLQCNKSGGDSLQLHRIVNRVVLQHVQLGNVLHDIQYWMSLLSECSLSSVNREKK